MSLTEDFHSWAERSRSNDSRSQDQDIKILVVDVSVTTDAWPMPSTTHRLMMHVTHLIDLWPLWTTTHMARYWKLMHQSFRKHWSMWPNQWSQSIWPMISCSLPLLLFRVEWQVDSDTLRVGRRTGHGSQWHSSQHQVNTWLVRRCPGQRSLRRPRPHRAR